MVGPWDLPCVFPIALRDPVALFPLFGVSRWCHSYVLGTEGLTAHTRILRAPKMLVGYTLRYIALFAILWVGFRIVCQRASVVFHPQGTDFGGQDLMV